MRILLIHPEDQLRDDPWAAQRWDRIVDLGRDGARSRAEAEAAFSVPVSNLDAFRSDFKGLRRARELVALGMGQLTDQYGLDWWELTSILVHEQLEAVCLMQQFVESIGSADEVHVSRPCFHAGVLRTRLGSRLRTFAPRQDVSRGLRHYVEIIKKFPVSQLFEIFWDKTDPGFQFRGRFSLPPRASAEAVILIPSAYVNVSRTANSYAEMLPEARFLVVATRHSGKMGSFPANVSVTSLRRYASVGATARRSEIRGLVDRWQRLRREFAPVAELKTLDDLGTFDGFPDFFAHGLEIRDAWRNVLEREPVRSILCGDTSNPYTHIPMLLAAHHRLPTIACHHGALDGRYMFKRNHADVMLAKGEMEQDYLVRACEIPAEAIEVGAPALAKRSPQELSRGRTRKILFFSEPYEAAGGRAAGFYRDLLSPLADLAMAEGGELIIKLHPSESFAERSRLVAEALTLTQRKIAHVVGGPLNPELLDQSWFGVTVVSTVAVECALRGIPCFLATWLESWPYGYVDQFTRFGVGIRLQEPEEIRQIPKLLESYRPEDVVRDSCWKAIAPQRLRSLLGLGQEVAMPQVVADAKVVQSST